MERRRIQSRGGLDGARAVLMAFAMKAAPPREPASARLTLEDVAERLNLERKTVIELTESGELRCLRIGKKKIYRFREAWLEEFIERTR